jgi:hypothetical protein
MRKEVLAEGVDNRWVTIYALCQPIDKWKTGEVRYIGKTVNTPWQRVRFHSYAAKRPAPRLPVSRWLKKQMAAGNPFHSVHLERVLPGDDWAARERYWIAKHRADGARLLNLTDGGEGLAGRPMPQSHRDKIAAALRTGDHFDCQVCGTQFWRKRKDILKGHNKFCSRACSNRRHR